MEAVIAILIVLSFIFIEQTVLKFCSTALQKKYADGLTGEKQEVMAHRRKQEFLQEPKEELACQETKI